MQKDVVLSIHLSEDDAATKATAELSLRGDHFEAVGTAKRNPTDPPKPLIGEELAIARALGKLQDQLVDAAWDKIEGFSNN